MDDPRVLKDVVIIITDIDNPDAEPDDPTTDVPYPVTMVYRYDLEGKSEDLIKHIEALPAIIEGGQMSNAPQDREQKRNK